MPTIIPASIASATFQSGAPNAPAVGGFWLDTDDGTLYFWNGSAWAEVAFDITASGGVPSSIGTTKGDVIAFSGAGVPVRVGVGVNGTVLQANSAVPAGVEFVSVGAVGDATGWVLIDQGVGPGGTGAFSFTGLDVYDEYRLIGRNLNGGSASSYDDVFIQFNGDTGTNYYNNNTASAVYIKIAQIPGYTLTVRGHMDVWISNDPSVGATVTSHHNNGKTPVLSGGGWITAEQVVSIDLTVANGFPSTCEFHIYGRNIA